MIPDGEGFEAKSARAQHDTRDRGVGMQIECFQVDAKCQSSTNSIVKCPFLVNVPHGVHNRDFENSSRDLLRMCDHGLASTRELERRVEGGNDLVEAYQRVFVPRLIQDRRSKCDILTSEIGENAFDKCVRRIVPHHVEAVQTATVTCDRITP